MLNGRGNALCLPKTGTRKGHPYGLKSEAKALPPGNLYKEDDVNEIIIQL
jgi:hypothetical protein